jgi:glycosyltransferase involved in cell wall biosynthesis
VNILLVNYEFPPLGGGGSKASFELARGLVRRGHRVDVLTGKYDGAEAVETIDGVRIHRSWSWRKSIHECGLRGAITFVVSALPRLRRLIKREEYDVLLYFFGFPTGLLSLYSGRVAKLPYIVSLRGSDVPLYDRDSHRLRFLHDLLKPLSRSIWANAAQVTAVSEGLREMANRSFPDIDVEVIHNGIDLPESVGHIRQPDKRGRPVRLNCVARLIPRKGIHDLIDAVSDLQDQNVEVHIIGTGPAEKELHELAKRRGVGQLVQFHGYQTPLRVQELNAKADIFVLPTWSEAFPNVILEAMSVGLPVIATRVGGIPEAVLDGVTGILVEPRDCESLARAIRRLSVDGDLRRSMGEAGFQRVRKQFSWDTNTDAFEQLLRSTAANAERKVNPVRQR